MGTDSDIESSNPEIQPLAEFDPNKEPVYELDERDVIEPLKKTVDEIGDQQPENESDAPADEVAGEQEISLDEMDGQAGSDDNDVKDYETDETEIHLDENDDELNKQSAPDEPQETNSDEEPVSLKAAPGDPDSDDGVVSEDETKDDDPEIDGDSPEDKGEAAEDPQKEASDNSSANDFVALDDDEVDDGIDAKPKEGEKAAEGDKKKEDVKEVQGQKKSAKDKDPDEIKKIEKNKAPLPKSIANNQKGEQSVKNTSSSKKIFLAIVIIFMIAGAIIYSKPALLGLKWRPAGVVAAKTEIEKPAEQTQIQVRKMELPAKNSRYLSKLEEIERLREELLAKKEEIYRLKVHYRNGIVELKDQIGQEMRGANISSFIQAIQNKRIELNLRTIQRRQVYIQELEKPDQWIHNGSEELLFLKRKALLDLQMTDIASGIDLDRHMRYMNAAIQKYQPSADKLAVDPPPAEITPLETIWSQILNRQVEAVQAPIGQKDEKIIAEICSENFRRVAELTAITSQAARCLARMNGSDLFLNGLTQLTPKEAKFLFQWQGNWICLNSVKTLSPAVAKYLFKWEGNWISLNGLTEFPPELALYLMEWKGNQLELMGLHYEKAKPDQRILKYLALWETMGGKLFVPDDIRNEMEQVM